MLTACLSVQGAWGKQPEAQPDEQQSDTPLADLYTNCPPPWNPAATPPRCPWYVRTEGVILQRDAMHATNFAELNVNMTNNVVLSTRDLDFPLKGGGRALIGHTINPCNQIEFSYMGVEHWSDSQFVRDGSLSFGQTGERGNLSSPFSNFGRPSSGSAVVGLDFNNFVSIAQKSTFQTAELNWRHYLDMPPGRLSTSLLVGVRYMEIRENFEYQSISELPAPLGSQNFVRTDTGNYLLGVQLGTLLEFYAEGPWWVNFEIKGALCQNDAAVTTDYINNNGVVTEFLHHRERRATSWVGDLALTVLYRFSPRLNARFGYQAIWVEGVALGDVNFQPNVNVLTLGPAQLKQDSNVVYHGPFAGLELAW